MKNYLLAGGLATILLLGACGDDTEADNTPETSEDAPQEAETETTDETTEAETGAATEGAEESSKGTRTNPYALGEAAEITVVEYVDGEAVEGTARVTIDNVLRGEDAMSEINYEGRGNEHDQYTDDESLERMVFHKEMELVEFVDDDTPYEARARVLTYNMDGEELPDDTVPNIQNDFGFTDLYQGGTASGQVTQVAPKEGPFLIKLVNSGSDDIFFKVE